MAKEEEIVEPAVEQQEIKGIEYNNIFISVKEIVNFVSKGLKKRTIKVTKAFEFLSKTFEIENEDELILLCGIIRYFCGSTDAWMSFNELRNILGKDAIDILSMGKSLLKLYDRRFIFNNKFQIKKDSIDLTPSGIKIYINKDFLDELINFSKNPLSVLKKEVEDIDLYTYLVSYDYGGLLKYPETISDIINDVVTEFSNNKIIKNLTPYLHESSKREISDAKKIMVFIILCIDNRDIECKTVLYRLSNRMDLVIRELEAIRNKSSPLYKCGIFEFSSGHTLDDMTVNLTPLAYYGLTGMEMKYIMKSLEGLSFISHNDITKKELFYNEANVSDITRLQEMLLEKNYKNITKRMKDKGYSQGLPIILYGGPGTGKTETVLQLAKKSGRDILKLNIEDVRSCWVGESEKNMKKVFSMYKDTLKTSKLAPILFLNEADAIVSKRTSIGHNASVDKMENAIQNILLDEIERFEGILIATTNLIDNIDPAFDRRFLFKLKLDNPTFDVKRKIWKSKLEGVDDNIITSLSRNYEFSGGQIDNIVKKVNIDNILFGSSPTKDTLEDFCKKELLRDDNDKHMGFSMN